jgi:diguanylate cyclase (GGDEF)-like protein
MKHKITLSLSLTLLSLTVAIVIIVGIAFRDYGISSATDKARVVAELVRDGLTVHMVNGIMDRRHYFMEKISSSKNIEKLWVVRSKGVIDQYGPGFTGEKAKDTIDAAVLATGRSEEHVMEGNDDVRLRVTIPYTASPDCLQCHTANIGDVIGVVSMVFDISDVRRSGLITTINIALVSILVLVLITWATNHGINRYLELFEALMEAIRKGHDGDFSSRITTSLKDEGGMLATLLNSLYEQLSEIVRHIDKKISILIGRTHTALANPLERTCQIVDELVDIYKFKKTIEIDKDKNEVYRHLVKVVENMVGHSDFVIVEISHADAKITVMHTTRDKWYCNLNEEGAFWQECRAVRSESVIYSDQQTHVCPNFIVEGNKQVAHMCMPYRLSSEISMLIQIICKDHDTLEKIKLELSGLINYLDAARPVLENHHLMHILQQSNLHDGLTGLLNRKYLDEFVDHIARQATRVKSPYGLLALDIDHFKMVNDTYGHDVGDIVIKGLADTVTSTIREADIAIRQGGEEFLVMLFNPTEEGVLTVAEKIREKFASHIFSAGGVQLRKTVSIGISMYPKDAEGMWHAIKCADIALYRAKDSGRNRVIRYTSDMLPTENGNY